MINAILQGISSFIFHLIYIIISPIDSIIVDNLPQLEVALGKFNDLLDYLITAIGYVADLTGLSTFAISLIVNYIIFALTAPVLVWVIKVLVKWWHALVP